MSFTVLQLSPSTMESIYPKTPFLYGMGRAFTKADALDLLKAENGYRPVAMFYVNTLDEVFEVSNSGRAEHLIERMEPMHSVSGGDIIVDDQEAVWIVAPDGFDLLAENLGDVLCSA